MNRAVTRSLGLLGALLLLAACEARPIPLHVAPNSTFLLPVNARAFGNAVSRSEGIEDRQRGNLVVAICPQADPWCSPAVNPPPTTCPIERPPVPLQGYYLGTRYVTTVMPHPASDAGLRGYLDFPNSPIYSPTPGLLGQDLALLDVPPNVCPGTYELTIRTFPVGPVPPDPNAPYAEEVITSGGVDIVVLDSLDVPGATPNPNAVNPFGLGNINVGPDLADLVPNPTVPLRLEEVGWTESYPAAAEIDVSYPANKVKILGAYQDKHLGIESVVSWVPDPNAGRVTISLVDPKRCTAELRIVFSLLGTDTVDPLTDFTTTPQDQRLYDRNGSLIFGNPYVIGVPTHSSLICGSD